MSTIQALFFGIIQGLCEFFPLSSSAHLELYRYFFNIKSNASSTLFELFCNGGTTLAAIIFLRKKIIDIVLNKKKEVLFIAAAILPLIPIYFFFRNILEKTDEIKILGSFFIITSILLFLASKTNNIKKYNSSLNRKIVDVLFIGFMQTLALIPGISRSGSTISTGCFRRWSIQDSVTFSFLLAIPTILGANFLEAIKLYKDKETIIEISFINYAIGFIASFIVGTITIKYIFSIKTSKKLLPFAWYCLIIGIVSLIYFNKTLAATGFLRNTLIPNFSTDSLSTRAL